jgi:hypothetical protein
MNSQDFESLPRSREEARKLGQKRFFTGRPCKYGHIAPRYVSTTQCVTCQLEHTRKNSGYQARPSKLAYLTRARTTIEEQGGVLLSTEYVSAKTGLEVRCSRGHEFLITPDALKSGGWCPKCMRANQSKQLATKFRSVEELREFCRQRHDGDCLATTPCSMHSKVLWKCANALHPPFEASVTNIVHNGSWCPACWQARRKPPTPPIPSEDIAKLVRKRGGKVVKVLGDWKGGKTKMIIGCANGHEWTVTAANLFFAGSWCPNCPNKGERIVRAIFEATFGTSFPKSRPDWLISREGFKLELDGYSERLRMAFEYQGPHHRTIALVRAHDEIKRQACAERGIQLIEVDAIKRPYPPQNVLAKVSEAFTRYHRSETPVLPERNLFDAELEELAALARARGGRLLSEIYLGYEAHEWKCAIKEHPSWHTRPEHIRNGSWCPACAVSRSRSKFAAQLRSWGNAVGLELLDEEYRGSQHALYRWRCIKAGHIIERTRRSITSLMSIGVGPCPLCAKVERI